MWQRFTVSFFFSILAAGWACNKKVEYSQASRRTPTPEPSPTTGPGGNPQLQSLAGVVAQINGAPASPNAIQNLNVTISGAGVEEFQYALGFKKNSCEDLVYSEWISIQEKITDQISELGEHILCVNGRTDEANPQTNPTTHKWTQATDQPIRAELRNTPNNGSTAKKLSVIVTGPERGVLEYAYSLVQGQSDCSDATLSSWIPVTRFIVDDIVSPGNYTLCVKGKGQAGVVQGDYTIHSWTQGEEQETPTPTPEPEDPTPQNVRIDLQDLNYEAWNKVCLSISAQGGPFEKLGCNKQDSSAPKDFLEFPSGSTDCVTLNFRLDVYQLKKDACNGNIPPDCPVESVANPTRNASTTAGARFFKALSADQITVEQLASFGMSSDEIAEDNIPDLQTKAQEWLEKSPGRQWIRLFAEDQTDERMNQHESGQTTGTGIDFDDFVIDIRSIDVNFEIPSLGVTCQTRN